MNESDGPLIVSLDITSSSVSNKNSIMFYMESITKHTIFSRMCVPNSNKNYSVLSTSGPLSEIEW